MSKMGAIKNKIYSVYGKRCEICGKKFKTKKLTGHHIIEKKHGGKITYDNILIACEDCHKKVINNIVYDSPEYWQLMYRALERRKKFV